MVSNNDESQSSSKHRKLIEAAASATKRTIPENAEESTPETSLYEKYLQDEKRVDILFEKFVRELDLALLQKKIFARYILWLTIGWVFAVLMVVIGKGFGWLQLSDTVLVTLIGSTTADIIGLLYIIVRFIFRYDKKTVSDQMDMHN